MDTTIEQILSGANLSATQPETLLRIGAAQDWLKSVEQIEVKTEHTFHAGMYARTVRIPADFVLTGTLVKIPTLLVTRGAFDVMVDDHWVRLNGYNVLTGEANRKQAFITRSEVEMTMIFRSNAETVEQAEREFTDEYHLLMSHNGANDIVMTGE